MVTATFLAALALAACSGGDDGDPGPAGPAGPSGPPGPPGSSTTLLPTENLPGLNITVAGMSGGTGPGGNFMVGDTVSVTFNLTQDDGTAVALSDLTSASIMISGPSFNYQRVLARQTNLITASVQNPGGSYTYTFADPLPATYLPPYNDTPSFGPGDGELQGQALMDGTYTVGLEGYRTFTVEGDNFRDPANEDFDFLVGNAATIDHREVVKIENCNACHVELRLHGQVRRDVKHCVLCHTSGAEDRNVASAANGTPGVTIDFRVLIHKIHNGAHLPSVLGVATNPNGSRNYAATPRPYQVVGGGNRVHDFSHVAFPVWPNLNNPMPRDAGYNSLSSTERGLEDTIRGGVTTCDKCHGDPDGDGPLTAPAQGHLAYEQPSRRACGACHDDIDWDLPYMANLQVMPPQPNDSSCTACHPATGAPFPVRSSHLHPVIDPAVNAGVNFDIMSVSEAGNHNGDGTIDPGERIAIAFTITDDAGMDIPPSSLSGIDTVVNGPTGNANLLVYSSVAISGLGAGPTHTINVPELLQLERVGSSSATTNGQTFTTAVAPHWNVSGAATEVWLQTAEGNASSLADPSSVPQNYVDVAPGTGGLFARDDYIVIDQGVAGLEEYMRIQWVQGDRLWFSSPYSRGYPTSPRFSHLAGSSVKVVTLDPKAEGSDYGLNPLTGTITETPELGDGVVVVTYTSDFVVPPVYGIPLNGSPDLGEEVSKWTGKSMASGTYTVGIWGRRDLSVMTAGETTTYRGPSAPATQDFLFGDATTIEPNQVISSPDNCYSCHNDIGFHGNSRRGLRTCLLCHGTAGAEDRARYVAANAPDTTGVRITFRQMLHKIHMGEELANAATYTVVGFGSGYPNNYSEHHYGEIVFPAMPGGVKHCDKCHGAGSTAWHEPRDRNHPTEQGRPVQAWAEVCGACHDSSAAAAHIELNTTLGGSEACAVCHGPEAVFNVALMHKNR